MIIEVVHVSAPSKKVCPRSFLWLKNLARALVLAPRRRGSARLHSSAGQSLLAGSTHQCRTTFGLPARRSPASGKFSLQRYFPEAVACAKVNSKMRLLPLIGATYFMVAGGPYGIEDILGDAATSRTASCCSYVPILCSLPTALMVGELASALARRGWLTTAGSAAPSALSWGFQEALALRSPPACFRQPSTRHLRP